jgi:hypothetical protein
MNTTAWISGPIGWGSEGRTMPPEEGLRALEPLLQPDLSLPERARDALTSGDSLCGAVSAAILRTAIYRLPDIPEPVHGVVAEPVGWPIPLAA